MVGPGPQRNDWLMGEEPARSTATGKPSFADRRREMVQRHIEGRGVRDRRVLDALATVPRERFVEPEFAEFAYEDSPLPIPSGQTISQPYIVAIMAEAARIDAGDRVLEIGTGSGYGAAVLGCMAGEVWSIERHHDLAVKAGQRLEAEGFENVHVLEGDGTLGWPEEAPFDAIIVTAGGPNVPTALQEQLADGGRLVMPVGPETRAQQLVRIHRRSDRFDEEDLGSVRFVPLVGAQGWEPKPEPEPSRRDDPDRRQPPTPPRTSSQRHARLHGLPLLVAESATAFASLDDAPLEALLDRIGDATYVLLGEASHGTAEFYQMRDRISRALITRKGFNVVAIEADWPDAAAVNDYIHGRKAGDQRDFEPFDRFPTWMWRNRQFGEFVGWLRAHNDRTAGAEVSLHGLDIYSMYRSRNAVIDYLEEIDPAAAAVARDRYGCLSPWETDPAAYGRAVSSGRFAGCEDGIVATLTDLLRRRLAYGPAGRDEFLDASQNAMIVANAERYYRTMYRGSTESWNVRDLHMFETLRTVQAHRGPEAKIIVWEHNSHVGDAAATEMGARGEHNVGMLARRAFGDGAYLIGFGTDNGTVAAASTWGGPMEHKTVRPALHGSYERICHETAIPAFLLPLRHPAVADLAPALAEPKLERAIGVIYRPETELQSHYFQASLPHQFDEYVWFDRSTAVDATAAHDHGGAPDTYPTGL